MQASKATTRQQEFVLPKGGGGLHLSHRSKDREPAPRQGRFPWQRNHHGLRPCPPREFPAESARDDWCAGGESACGKGDGYQDGATSPGGPQGKGARAGQRTAANAARSSWLGEQDRGMTAILQTELNVETRADQSSAGPRF